MEPTVITGEENTRNYRLLVIRRGLKLKIQTGLNPTRGVSMLTLANSVTKKNDRTLRAAYASLDAHITAKMGAQFASPL